MKRCSLWRAILTFGKHSNAMNPRLVTFQVEPDSSGLKLEGRLTIMQENGATGGTQRVAQVRVSGSGDPAYGVLKTSNREVIMFTEKNLQIHATTQEYYSRGC